MNIDMNGRLVHHIIVRRDSDHDFDYRIGKEDYQKMFFSATHHGDHDEFWVVVKHDGEEVCRYNCKDIKRISWT